MALRGTESLHQPAPHLTYSHNHWEGMGLVGVAFYCVLFLLFFFMLSSFRYPPMVFLYFFFFLPFLKTYLTHSPTRLFGLLGLLSFLSLYYITLYICIKWGWGWGLDGDDGGSEYDYMN